MIEIDFIGIIGLFIDAIIAFGTLVMSGAAFYAYGEWGKQKQYDLADLCLEETYNLHHQIRLRITKSSRQIWEKNPVQNHSYSVLLLKIESQLCNPKLLKLMKELESSFREVTITSGTIMEVFSPLGITDTKVLNEGHIAQLNQILETYGITTDANKLIKILTEYASTDSKEYRKRINDLRDSIIDELKQYMKTKS